MEPISIIAGVTINWLVRFLKCTGEEAAKKAQEEIGSSIWNKIKSIFSTVETNFEKDRKTDQIINGLKRAPDNEDLHAEAFHHLKEMMKVNENLSILLSNLLQEVNKPNVEEKINKIIWQTSIRGDHNVVNQISGNTGGINIGSVTGRITINQQPDINIKQLTDDGLRLLKVKNYSKATIIFNQLLEKDSSNPDLYFYLALTILAGQRPKALTITKIAEIEKNIDFAIEEGNLKAHYFYLKAIVKYDFYLLNGFSVEISDINKLLEMAQHASYDELAIREMLRHMAGVDKDILDCIRLD